MRPDETCVTGERVPGRRSPPCGYHYMKGGKLRCGLFDLVKDAAPKKTPRDLMNEGVVSREILFKAFLYCVRLIVVNPEAECNRCGGCCKMWAKRDYALHPDKPCKGKGTLDDPENPCMKLIDNGDGTYSCAIYGSENFVKTCDPFPDGTEYGFFEQLLDGIPFGQIKRLLKCPSCVFEFGRES